MKIQFENMRGNASPRGKGTNVPANARWGNTNLRNYKSFSSAALDPHPTVANPLLPFGRLGQMLIDIAAAVVNVGYAVLLVLSVVGAFLGSLFLLIFCKF